MKAYQRAKVKVLVNQLVHQQVIQTQLVQVLAIVKVQVSVIRSVHQLVNLFQLAQVNLQASQQATAAAVQSVRVKAQVLVIRTQSAQVLVLAKVQVIAHQSVIQDRIVLV